MKFTEEELNILIASLVDKALYYKKNNMQDDKVYTTIMNLLDKIQKNIRG